MALQILTENKESLATAKEDGEALLLLSDYTNRIRASGQILPHSPARKPKLQSTATAADDEFVDAQEEIDEIAEEARGSPIKVRCAHTISFKLLLQALSTYQDCAPEPDSVIDIGSLIEKSYANHGEAITTERIEELRLKHRLKVIQVCVQKNTFAMYSSLCHFQSLEDSQMRSVLKSVGDTCRLNDGALKALYNLTKEEYLLSWRARLQVQEM